MNLLVNPLPKSLSILGEDWEIRWDFRTGILYELLLAEEDLTQEEMVFSALALFYPVIPPDIGLAIEKMQWFHNCGQGKEKTNVGRKGTSTGQGPYYSFVHDSPYIYSAFLAQYGIDLTEVTGLHWWQFRGLFQGLSQDCVFSKIMGYRAMEIPEGLGREQKQFYRRMKELYRIPLGEAEEERTRAIQEALLSGGDLTGLL